VAREGQLGHCPVRCDWNLEPVPAFVIGRLKIATQQKASFGGRTGDGVQQPGVIGLLAIAPFVPRDWVATDICSLEPGPLGDEVRDDLPTSWDSRSGRHS